MNQLERLDYLLEYLINDSDRYKNEEIPSDIVAKKRLLRGLFNVRMPKAVSEEFLQVQDDYLKEENFNKGIVDANLLKSVQSDDRLVIWQGDITSLKVGAIVNAANNQMLGCFYPNHGCIDNAIHTFSGVQLRLACNEIMQKQGHKEETGVCKITSGYNLPCDYVLHTVGPIIYGALSEDDCELLASCYVECLKTASANNIKSVAFCCISTGEFHFPNDVAAQIAVDSVQEFLDEDKTIERVVFNVFKDRDLQLYRDILGEDK